jgi:transcription initiation factor TFIID subunit 5
LLPSVADKEALLENYIDNALEVYRPELARLLWPVFVHCSLTLAEGYYSSDCEAFQAKFKERFEREHSDELRQLAKITQTQHLEAENIGKLYLENKYRVTITSMAYTLILQFLEEKEANGGYDIMQILVAHVNIVTVKRSAAGPERSLAAMMSKQGEEFDYPGEDEGIPGHNPGSANTGPNPPAVLTKLALGPLPMEPELMDDVRAELEEEDAREPPEEGYKTLLETFNEKIKTEPTDDSPSRDSVPLPPSVARNVAQEVQKIREHRDRFKIDPRTSGTAPGISICMYTLHNTHDKYVDSSGCTLTNRSSFHCIDFSGDLMMMAAGTSMSYIQVWSVDGSPLVNKTPGIKEEKPSHSRRLIGHSAPVYAVSFEPGTDKPLGDPHTTAPRLLLSSSGDKTIRLWTLDGWACLCVFRSHMGAVWDVKWGPFGHYFLSAGGDRVARVWSQDQISPLRMFVGHDDDVDCCCFHPNGAYVFTAGDKSVRMWDIMKGTCVRLFTSHIGNITALECAPDGKTVASADDQGTINLWDLASGRLLKRMRGHGKGGIWSLSWSVESSVLVSGGADMTVRTWDPTLRTAERGEGVKVEAGLPTAGGTAAAAGGGAQKKAKKDAVVTPDQISAFPTKRSPVYKVHFSRANLVLAGGAYLPEPVQGS